MELEEALYLVVRGAFAGRTEPVEVILGAFHEGLQALFATWELESQVANGGLIQFFDNTSDLAGPAIRGYELFGAARHAEIVREALHELEGIAGPFQREQAGQVLDAYLDTRGDAILRALEEELQDLSGLSPNRVGYLRAHAEEIAASLRRGYRGEGGG
jgi:hypothetical protein